MIHNKKAFYDSMKATMNIVGTLAMLVAVCVINFDKDLALACALSGGFVLSIENMIPCLPDEKETNNKATNVKHKFQAYDLRRGPRRIR